MKPEIRIEQIDSWSEPPHTSLRALLSAATATARRALPHGWRRSADAVAGILTTHTRWLAQFAVVGDGGASHIVGFKLGYAERPHRFYSWLGGVDPDFRRQGIARRLLDGQHRWCLAHGFEVVHTATTNGFKPMLMLNLDSGFDVVGTRQGEEGLMILLEKRLIPPDRGRAADAPGE